MVRRGGREEQEQLKNKAANEAAAVGGEQYDNWDPSAQAGGVAPVDAVAVSSAAVPSADWQESAIAQAPAGGAVAYQNAAPVQAAQPDWGGATTAGDQWGSY